jgi:ADP-ribose pyrophosphatase
VKDEPEHWPVTESHESYRDGLIAVRNDMVRFPDDSQAERTVVLHPGAVAVVALDDDQRVLMIRQYRHPVQGKLWEIPAGLRDVPGEDLLAAAQRELAEEASYRASQWSVVADWYPSPGFSDERIRCFLARGLEEITEGDRTFVMTHEEAYLERAWLPLGEAVAAVLCGDLHNGVAAMGILAVYALSNGALEG